ncbi:MAG: TipAS antibiotic-recognition domain-containing protein [Acidobacteriota bacterium]|nr:TipAS antibiotic-recognition domain-containing protein [Acidobacteriota bacterium]
MSSKKPDLSEIGEILGDQDLPKYQREAEERYGDTDDWVISQKRVAKWSRDDWLSNKERFDAVEAELADAVRRGVATDSAEAAVLVEKHRELLSAFFPVSAAKHYMISRAYINDERFKTHYESRQAGLAVWLAEAIENVAERSGVDLQNPEWE